MALNAALIQVDYPVAGEEKDWRIGSPCGEVHPDFFFDMAEEDQEVERQAKLICRECPVADLCLDAAMIAGEEYGIWGGLNPQERSRYRRTWQRRKGGKKVVRSMRKSSARTVGITSYIERKYEARQRAALRCRELLMHNLTFDRREDYMMVLDMIIANPSEVSDNLAKRIGRSATWFNSMKREVYGLFGIQERAM